MPGGPERWRLAANGIDDLNFLAMEVLVRVQEHPVTMVGVAAVSTATRHLPRPAQASRGWYLWWGYKCQRLRHGIGMQEVVMVNEFSSLRHKQYVCVPGCWNSMRY